MDTPDTALRGQNTTAGGRLYMAFELGEKNWKLSLGDGQRAPSRCTVAAGDTTAVLTAIANARARCHLGADAPVYSCYEAGRDGFWLHRWLTEQGIVNLVVDSASIEVNRRARRAKTDRLDSRTAVRRCCNVAFDRNPPESMRTTFAFAFARLGWVRSSPTYCAMVSRDMLRRSTAWP
uniref:hypothetical protein n=1 Tax=Paraburkholderia sediminicola TaxID=458836 RepID=UPI0038BE12A6